MSEQSFKQAYEVLSRHAQTLRDQTEPGIDDLLKIVTESVQAFKVCSQRIDAVEKALEQALATAEREIAASPGKTAGKTATVSSEGSPAKAPAPAAEPLDDEEDRDIPF